jgi:hypothetical protein
MLDRFMERHVKLEGFLLRRFKEVRDQRHHGSTAQRLAEAASRRLLYT